MADLQQFNTELGLIEQLLHKLNTIAKEDGKITKDEKVLLESIEEDLTEYKKLVMEILENNAVSEDQKNRLRKFKQQIFEHARKIAAEDGRYYEDEWHLLEPLTRFAKQGL